MEKMVATEASLQMPYSSTGQGSLALKARRRRMEDRRNRITTTYGPLSEPSIKRLRRAQCSRIVSREMPAEVNNPIFSLNSERNGNSSIENFMQVDNLTDTPNLNNFVNKYNLSMLSKEPITNFSTDCNSSSDSDSDTEGVPSGSIEVDSVAEIGSVASQTNASSNAQGATSMNIDEIPKTPEPSIPVPSLNDDSNSYDHLSLNSVSTCCSESRFGKPADECPSHGLHSICGRRRDMEDAVATVPCFASVPCESSVGCKLIMNKDLNGQLLNYCKLHFFGVFDGHGGHQAANFCSKHLHKTLASEINQTIKCSMDDSVSEEFIWKKVMTEAFRKTDSEIEPIAPETVGSTAVVAIVGSSRIIVANCGDSRAVLSRGGKAVPLSKDHKPDREDELQRIEGLGGRVIFFNGFRVLGVLAMSRALGDRYLKPYVIPEPDLTFTSRSDDDECIILATDGLWDVVSNDAACEIARRYLNSDLNESQNLECDGFEAESPASRAAAVLTRIALTKGSGDNISVVVIDLQSLKQ